MIVCDASAAAPELFARMRELVTNDWFPWYYGYATSREHPVMMHGVKIRGEDKPNSSMFSDVDKLLTTICEAEGLKRGKILRAAFNMSVGRYDNVPTLPHVDHSTPHGAILIYFVADGGDTIIFNEVSVGTVDKTTHDKVTEKYRITPEVGKGIIFNGMHYHCNEFPNTAYKRRLVLVVTFELSAIDLERLSD